MLKERLELALRQIQFARAYTLTLLEDVADERWFEKPPGCVTHIAWQVGHLAMAEYGLALFRPRGRQPSDLELMNSRFRKQFSRGSEPSDDAAQYPSPAEIRGVLDRVHEQVQLELPGYSAEILDQPAEAPYTGFASNFGAILFCSHHEMIHAGQIGLLRRMMGQAPVR